MKLIQKTTLGYLIYSVFILLIAIPVFYLVIQNILRHEIDEELLGTKEILKPRLQKALSNHPLDRIDFLDQNMTIALSGSLQESDTLYTAETYNAIAKEIIPYRVIESVFVLDGKAYKLYKKMSLVETDDLIKSIFKVQVLLLILLLAGIFVINRNLSKKIWRPFYQTLDRLKQYKVELDKSLQLDQSGINEFADLNQSLKALTERSHQVFASQKEFTENASHEMQTPLAIFQSKLELLMQTYPLNAEQAGLMDELADAAQRMWRLNKSLLLLTKIENNQFPEVEAVSLNRVVAQYIQQYEPLVQEKELTVTVEEQAELTAAASKTLMEILLGNLIGNAIRHNVAQGKIMIRIKANELEISNSGKQTSLNEKNLFRRFQKESADSNSIGLGLEIVKKITELYGYQLNYRFDDGLHCFSVRIHS